MPQFVTSFRMRLRDFFAFLMASIILTMHDWSVVVWPMLRYRLGYS
jgi:hypothetical protein